MLDLKKFSKKTVNSLYQWPYNPEETQGYILMKKNKLLFAPTEVVSLEKRPTCFELTGKTSYVHFEPLGGNNLGGNKPGGNNLGGNNNDPIYKKIKDGDRTHVEKKITLLGTFHSHPNGCTENVCYLQPPSTIDITSFRALCIDLELPAHVIVAKDRLFFVKTHAASKPRFDAMFEELTELRDKNLSPETQEPLWFDIARRYPDVMTVEVIDLPAVLR